MSEQKNSSTEQSLCGKLDTVQLELWDRGAHRIADALSQEFRRHTKNCSNTATDVQVGGDHYKLKIQPIEFIHANNIPFIEGNIIKYICRWRKKGGREDLKKIRHYLDLLEELEYGA